MTIGIDASRNRSGGAKAHLIGIITEGNPLKYGIEKVHVWSYKSLLDALPDFPWLVKHNPAELELSLFRQVWWQYNALPKEATKYACDILLNTDAGAISTFAPSIVMSRDMLSYEDGEMRRYGFSFARIRLLLLKYIQANSMKRATGVIFLTNYAATVIQKFMGPVRQFAVIPHGVGQNFKQTAAARFSLNKANEEIKCIYISNTAMYKHQWHVVNAIGQLQKKGYKISLLLVGGGDGIAQEMLEREMTKTDPDKKFTTQLTYLAHDKIPALIAESDIFIFASSCENMPNTLVEGMAAGIPIACSNRGPMPEVLKDGGIYFDPENAASITEAVEKIILNEDLRLEISKRAKELSTHYSWQRCANETFEYLTQIYQQSSKRK